MTTYRTFVVTYAKPSQDRLKLAPIQAAVSARNEFDAKRIAFRLLFTEWEKTWAKANFPGEPWKLHESMMSVLEVPEGTALPL